MSMFSLQNPLRQLLSEYKLSHLYETLREKEFDSLDILKECSEDDVSALSQSLHLCLADKLRFKRALKSVNIPKHSVCYKIVNKEEQQYIVNIEKSLQRMQNMVGNNSISASNQELIKRNENVIHSSSDTLSSTYNDVEYTNKEIMNHLNTAKSIKKQCQQLLMKDDHLNDIDSRTNSIKNLHDECLKKEKMIANIVHRNISYKSQHITSRNAYNHTFSIPIYCGKTSHYENHITKLKISNNRRIVCGGLWWDIYIHPNQGENSNGFALSVFPVKSTMEEQLPDHYKLKYTVFTSLNITQMDEDEKSVSNFDASWHRELSHIVYDANVSHIEWQWTKERLPFSINDLIEYNDDNEYFNLYVRINTSFIMKKGSRTSQYNGVLGAILLDSESVMGEQRKEIDTLKHNKDALQKQLETTNKLNVQLTDNMSKMMTQIAKLTKEQQRSNDIMKEITQSLQTQLSTQQSAINNPSAFFNRSQSPVLNLQQQRGNNSHPSPSDTNTNTNKSKFEPATVTTHIAPNLPPVQPTNAKPTDVRTEEKKQAEEDHKQETVTTSNETILDSTDVITDTIDASWEIMFEHRPVVAWRYDEKESQTTKNDKKENNTGDVNNNNDDDNGNYTLKPIVSLSEVDTEEKKQVEDDHKQETVTASNETMLDSIDVITDAIDASWEVMFENGERAPNSTGSTKSHIPREKWYNSTRKRKTRSNSTSSTKRHIQRKKWYNSTRTRKPATTGARSMETVVKEPRALTTAEQQ